MGLSLLKHAAVVGPALGGPCEHPNSLLKTSCGLREKGPCRENTELRRLVQLFGEICACPPSKTTRTARLFTTWLARLPATVSECTPRCGSTSALPDYAYRVSGATAATIDHTH
jgi:hypothetical protein